MTDKRSFLIDNLHILVLWGFAMAQPLYDLLGKYPEFLVAHRAGLSAILGLILVVSILAPFILVVVESLAGLVLGNRFRRVIHLIFIGLLTGLIVLPPLNRWGILPQAMVIIISILTGGMVAAFYVFRKIIRSILTAMVPAILIFPAYFLIFTPVKSLVLPNKTAPVSIIKIKNIVPVTLIVFDEFNAMALLNENGIIDSVRYPNFAALAKGGWWFPNAIASSIETVTAVPAILTGKEPTYKRQKLATYTQYPHNLFTLLSGKYLLNVHESETSLCPDEINNHSIKINYDSFISDILTIYRAVLFPGLFRQSVNSIDAQWKNFNASGSPDRSTVSKGWDLRKQQVEAFISGITAESPNQLNFMHIDLPHVPYEYLSSGKLYNKSTVLPEGLISEDASWDNSKDLVEVAYQRYLQQVGFTDKVLGMVVTGLKEKGVYDQSLFIITADHGVSMRTNTSRRSWSFGDLRDLWKVPLIVKLPDQKKGSVNHALISGLDILPTIAHILGISIPWKLDGGWMLSGLITKRNQMKMILPDLSNVAEINIRDIDGCPLLGWQTSVFGSGTPLSQLVRKEKNQSLLGRDIAELDVRTVEHHLTIEVENPDQFRHVDLNSNYLPALLRGRVKHPDTKKDLALAIALNGKIRAITSTAHWLDDAAFFVVLFPEAAFYQGNNDLDIFIIKENRDGKDSRLIRIPIKGQESVFLHSEKIVKESLVFEDGRVIPVKDSVVRGYMDGIHRNESTVFFTGWAFDVTGRLPVQSVVIFSGDRSIARIKPVVERKDVVSYLGTEKAMYSGFQLDIPVNAFTGGEFRAFGITKNGEAGNLIILVKDQLDTILQKKAR